MKLDSLDLLQLGSCGLFFTIRLYREGQWGPRKLGAWRYAFDLGRISLIFERYWLG